MVKYPIPVVRVIIENENNEILLLKRNHDTYAGGKWCLPGGKVDYYNTIEETCIGEVKEETNLNIIESNLEFLLYQNNLPKKNDKVHYISFYFSTKKYGGSLKINSESCDYDWVDLSKLDNYDIAFDNDKIIEKYFSRQ